MSESSDIASALVSVLLVICLILFGCFLIYEGFFPSTKTPQSANDVLFRSESNSENGTLLQVVFGVGLVAVGVLIYIGMYRLGKPLIRIPQFLLGGSGYDFFPRNKDSKEEEEEDDSGE